MSLSAHARIALFLLCKSAAVKRVRKVRIDLQGSVVTIDHCSEFAELEISEGTAVERVGVVRPVPERLVAICKSLSRIAHDGSRYAPRVERLGILWIEFDRLVKIGRARE
jgi:hypothetical protein